MKQVSYPGHFAGAVEAASSTGGRIAAPIMGAAAGIVAGVITLTGVTFRLGFMVTQGALGTAEMFHAALAFAPFELFSIEGAAPFVSACYIAMACVKRGPGAAPDRRCTVRWRR